MLSGKLFRIPRILTEGYGHQKGSSGGCWLLPIHVDYLVDEVSQEGQIVGTNVYDVLMTMIIMNIKITMFIIHCDLDSHNDHCHKHNHKH